VHSMAAGEGFGERDVIAARNLRRREAPGSGASSTWAGWVIRHPLSPHLRSVRQPARARGQAVRFTESGGVIVVRVSRFVALIRYLVERLPVYVRPRWVSPACRRSGIAACSTYLIAALQTPEATGQVIEIGGADVVTYAH